MDTRVDKEVCPEMGRAIWKWLIRLSQPACLVCLVATFLYEAVPGRFTKRQPSDDAIEPLLSTIQMRSGNASREPRSAVTRPIG